MILWLVGSVLRYCTYIVKYAGKTLIEDGNVYYVFHGKVDTNIVD